MEQELITLGILFFFALIGGVLAARFKQPVLLGLLVVGAAIGPKALGLIKSENILAPMIEFGAILMLFVIGLEFDISKLKKIGLKAILIATTNSAILTFVGFMISILLGFNVQTAMFMGVIISFGSTVVIVKVLENKGMMHRQEVPLLLAVLIIEDILAVLIITFFSGVMEKGSSLMSNIESMLISMVLLIVSYIIFVRFIKPLLAWTLKNNSSDEITTFTALALCAGFAYLAYYLKLSPAVGAFMAGSIVASLPSSKEFEKAIMPYNLVISSFFFIAIGTLIDFAVIKENIMIILLFVAVVIITKLITFSSLVYFFANMKGDKMFFSSVAMCSVGEFSLLIAKQSTKFNLGIDLVSISAAIIAISALIMSIAISYSDRLYQPTMENMPYSFRKKMDETSSYIKSISEELDLDNKHSQGLKNNITGFLSSLLVIMLIIFGWRKLSVFMISQGLSSSILTTTYMAVMILLTAGLFYTAIKMKRIVKSLSEIFANATNMRNTIQSKKIVIKMFMILGTIITILSFPFMMFMFNLEKIYLIIPGILIIALIWQINRLSKTSKKDNSNYVSHSKVNYDMKQGWKI